MIPLMAVLGLRTRRNRIFRIWIPIFLVWLLLLPLVLVLLPFFIVGCLVVRSKPFMSIATGWQILAGLSGMHIELEDPEHYVLIRLI